ncbi:MAG: glycosyltransferase family 39 protein [Acidimicrobiales bacterium]|nr:glycosyltransferase family 39 protein [Acidimicrobiales bacterium]MCB9393968.1 glycosyltransferase family 39 protein [Acidimicrobiaceae bacterium]
MSTATTELPTHTEQSPWPSYLRRAGIAYLASRLCVIAGAAIVAAQQVAEANRDGLPRPKNAVGLIVQVLTSWDGAWYYRIIRDWYPTSIPPDVTYDDMEARAAFFPTFPMVVRAADAVLPGGDVFAGVFVNFVLGALAIWLIGLLTRDLFGERIAYRAMVLMAFFPGSVALSLTYSEATLITVAAACLLMLHRKQWLAAGVLAAIGSGTRPNGVGLVAACVVAAFLAIRHDRDWKSLIAPALAPIGFISFQLYLLGRTDEFAWFRVQREAWDEGTSFGLTAVRNTLEAFTHPLSSPTDTITAVSVLAMIALLVVLWKRPLPWPMVAFTLVVLALMILPATVTARPRFLFTAFPLFISAAAWWPEHHEEGWGLTIAMSAAGIVALTGLYGVLGAIP